jgi:hypothetical protein
VKPQARLITPEAPETMEKATLILKHYGMEPNGSRRMKLKLPIVCFL